MLESTLESTVYNAVVNFITLQLFEHAVNFLSKIRTVSQSDAKRLLCTFGSLQSIARTSRADLEHCPGLGPVKAQYIHDFFRTPFLI